MKLRLISLLMLSTTILTTCTTIPRSGPVMSAEIEGASSSANVDFLPPGPSAGATPEEIIAGFIAAGPAAQDT